ncbi:HIT family hydrolase [Bacillus coahuilensis p1.1.43]|uniref:HIT family hydrolase n=1 Tax=Bacillus coahuilensis p1.1.43 TaxID=1150625 RepID=A0A147KC79_9BACI|nr:HIT family protein [Bacillus coahuilensis]KUP09202.1 HIT family hydrolase [Bacillus coahuilensis p1.1.43]
MIETCFGCRLANKEEPVHMIWENDYVSCFLDHLPFNDGHVLILPKKHVRYLHEMDETTLMEVMGAVQLISAGVHQAFEPDGITICQNGGSFDDLTHFHMHVVPRCKGQDFAEFYREDTEEAAANSTRLLETKDKLVKAILHCEVGVK